MHRPKDDDVVTLQHALEWQRAYVLAGGAPVAAQVLAAVLEDRVGDRRIADMLPERVRFGDLPGLRIMAAMHLLALQGKAPRIASHAPSMGGIPPAEADLPAFRADVIDALAAHAETLGDVLSRPPQTNEVARASLLRCALSRLGPDSPVRLREFGCSAGLNLRADQLPGRPGLEAGPLPPVVDRVGCDQQPIDASTPQGKQALSSYIWMDDVERMLRLRAAFDVADRFPATVLRQDAASFISDIALADDVTTVVWHSAMWVYLSPAKRAQVLAALESLAATATSTARMAHASWEWATELGDGERTFHLVLRTWQGDDMDGVPMLLAKGNGHGGDVTAVPLGGRRLAAEPLSP